MKAKDTEGPLLYLGAAARELRRERQIRLIEVAYHLRKSEGALSKFESAKTRPHNLNETIEVYAEVLDLAPRAIWERAFDLWEHRGTID